MRGKPRWISRKALLLLHEETLAEFGGAPGVADEALLDSALARPRNTFAYKPQSTVADLAASCAYGIARNHAFIDGNKRVAFLAIGIFLAINGYRLTAEPFDAIQTIFALAAGELHEKALAGWIAKNSVKIDSRK
jgi:death-on-curing protein